MQSEAREVAGIRCLVVADDAIAVAAPEDGRALVEAAMGERARVIAVPVRAIDPEFFRLRSGLAGEVLQKAATYGFRFAIVGDISAYVAGSDALRDFVIECARGGDVLFVPDLPALAERLAPPPSRTERA